MIDYSTLNQIISVLGWYQTIAIKYLLVTYVLPGKCDVSCHKVWIVIYFKSKIKGKNIIY